MGSSAWLFVCCWPSHCHGLNRDGLHNVDREQWIAGVFAPAFEKETGIAVKVVAVGTGQAIDSARRGDADVLFVHDKAQEERFVSTVMAFLDKT